MAGKIDFRFLHFWRGRVATPTLRYFRGPPCPSVGLTVCFRLQPDLTGSSDILTRSYTSLTLSLAPASAQGHVKCIMDTALSDAVLFHVSSTLQLPENPSINILQRFYRPPGSIVTDARNKRWVKLPATPLSRTGHQGLLRYLQCHQPQTLFISLPSVDPDHLTNPDLTATIEAATALKSYSQEKQITTILLFTDVSIDTPPSAYKSLFNAQRVHASYAACSMLDALISPQPSVWTNLLTFTVPIQAPLPTISLHHPKRPLKLPNSPAVLVALSRDIPSHPAFMHATPGHTLTFSPKCEAGIFANSWYKASTYWLIRIGDCLFCVYWKHVMQGVHSRYRIPALYLPTVSNDLVSRLDPCVWREHIRLRNTSEIRYPPHQIRNLPKLSMVPVSSPVTSEDGNELNMQEQFNAAIDVLTRRVKAVPAGMRLPSIHDAYMLEVAALRANKKKYRAGSLVKARSAQVSDTKSEFAPASPEKRRKNTVKAARNLHGKKARHYRLIRQNAALNKRKIQKQGQRRGLRNGDGLQMIETQPPLEHNKIEREHTPEEARQLLERGEKFFPLGLPMSETLIGTKRHDRTWRGLAARHSDAYCDGSMPTLTCSPSRQSSLHRIHGVNFCEDNDERLELLDTYEEGWQENCMEFHSFRDMRPDLKASKALQAVAAVRRVAASDMTERLNARSNPESSLLGSSDVRNVIATDVAQCYLAKVAKAAEHENVLPRGHNRVLNVIGTLGK